jgi:hypothetical protein
MEFIWPQVLKTGLFGFGISLMDVSNLNLQAILKIFTLLIGPGMENVLFLEVVISPFGFGILKLGFVEGLYSLLQISIAEKMLELLVWLFVLLMVDALLL